jgi:hypothetical protein
MASESLRERYVSILVDRLNETAYPSAPMMDRIEAAIVDRGTAEQYLSVLLERVAQDRYPSPTMLERLNGLIATFERASTS